MARIDRQSSVVPPKPQTASSAASGGRPIAVAPSSADRDNLSLEQNGKDLRDFSRFLQNQNAKGITNGCGTTSLAMLLSAWKGKPGAYTRESIDQSIRRFNLPTSPQNIVKHAQEQGFRAEAKNNASLADLKGYLDKGVPVQVMFDPDGDGSDSVLHYVVVTDYEADAQGKITGVKIADPWGGVQKTVPVDEFSKRWDKLELLGRSTGLNNLMIPVLPKENTAIRGKDGVSRMSNDISLPDGGGLGWRMAIADKAFDVANVAGKVTEAVASAPRKVWKALSSL